MTKNYHDQLFELGGGNTDRSPKFIKRAEVRSVELYNELLLLYTFTALPSDISARIQQLLEEIEGKSHD